jgi:hypothetical protein
MRVEGMPKCARQETGEEEEDGLEREEEEEEMWIGGGERDMLLEVLFARLASAVDDVTLDVLASRWPDMAIGLVDALELGRSVGGFASGTICNLFCFFRFSK